MPTCRAQPNRQDGFRSKTDGTTDGGTDLIQLRRAGEKHSHGNIVREQQKGHSCMEVRDNNLANSLTANNQEIFAMQCRTVERRYDWVFYQTAIMS